MNHAVRSYRIEAGRLSALVSPYGAMLQGLYLEGHQHSLVLGSNEPELYRRDLRYAGAIIGPVANRISRGRFTLGGKQYQVDQNFLEKHCLHSGHWSTADRIWDLQELTPSSARFGLQLKALESGFPGPMQVTAEYRIRESNQLELQIDVSSDELIPCNWAHHCYFHLDSSNNLNNHQLQVFADSYLPVDSELIPTGEIRSVAGSRFDLRLPKSLEQAAFDHNFCTATARAEQPLQQAKLSSSASGVELVIESTEQGLQVYTGDHLILRNTGLAGVALEPQGWPDALNRSHFPSIALPAKQRYRQFVRYSLSD